MASEQELAGRVALVTGASRNIGRAIALALGAAGAAVVVNARASRVEVDAVVAEVERRGGRALAALADVTDEGAVGAMIEAAVARFGRLDYLVNNAAVRRERAIEEIDLAEFRAVVNLILEGAFLCVRAALPHLKRSGAATIVNIGGMTGHAGAAGRAHVVTGKAGLVGLTKALAHELSPIGITVNCVVPGLIDTVRIESAEPIPEQHRRQPPVVGRRGRPEEIASMVRYLCGPSARFVTGQTVHVNGGALMP